MFGPQELSDKEGADKRRGLTQEGGSNGDHTGLTQGSHGVYTGLTLGSHKDEASTRTGLPK